MLATPAPPLPFERLELHDPTRHYRCPRDWSWRSRLPDYDLWLALGGVGELTIDGTPIPVEAPLAVLLRPGNEVAGRHDPARPLEVIALHFTPRGRVPVDWALPLRTVRPRPPAFFRELGERLVEEHTRGDALGRRTSETLALSLLGALWRLAHSPRAEPDDDRLDALVRQIQREPEHPWTLDELAERAAMGSTRLNQRCRELTGFAPMAWVIRCRLERAALLLAETDLKLAQIAEACGYRDVYFFARQFRQRLGVTPGEYRRTRRTPRPPSA